MGFRALGLTAVEYVGEDDSGFTGVRVLFLVGLVCLGFRAVVLFRV